VNAHDVRYAGMRNAQAIFGNWEIERVWAGPIGRVALSGLFRIWPLIEEPAPAEHEAELARTASAAASDSNR
jgi:hypothetical protein